MLHPLLELLAKLAPSWLKKIKLYRKYISGASIIICSALYISSQYLSPYISLVGTSAAIHLPRFQTFDLSFKSPVGVKSYTLTFENVNGGSDGIGQSAIVTSKSFGRELPGLSIDFPNETPEVQTNLNSGCVIQINFFESLENNVVSASTNGSKIPLEGFLKNNLRGQGEYVRFRYIRKWLGQLITGTNEAYSNVFLTLVFFGLSFELIRLVVLEVRYWVSTDAVFKEYLMKHLEIKDSSNVQDCVTGLNLYKTEWWELDNWLRFLQVLGPAIGFLLTVSSLVQALHPSQIDSKNVHGFLNGIHVAMIATFLGLALRLVALEAARINDKLLHRALTLLDGAPSDSNRNDCAQ